MHIINEGVRSKWWKDGGSRCRSKCPRVRCLLVIAERMTSLWKYWSPKKLKVYGRSKFAKKFSSLGDDRL